MSRSARHTPITGITTAATEKPEKTRAHRRLRQRNRQALRSALRRGTERDFLPWRVREISDVWHWAKDGKVRWRPPFGVPAWRLLGK